MGFLILEEFVKVLEYEKYFLRLEILREVSRRMDIQDEVKVYKMEF